MKSHLTNFDRRYNYIILAENFYLDDYKEKAVKFYFKALNFHGEAEEDLEILYNIAIIYDKMDKLTEALKTYKEIVKLNTEESGAFYGIATIYERLGNSEKALEYYFKAIEINPKYDRAFFYIANIYDEIG